MVCSFHFRFRYSSFSGASVITVLYHSPTLSGNVLAGLNEPVLTVKDVGGFVVFGVCLKRDIDVFLKIGHLLQSVDKTVASVLSFPASSFPGAFSP